MPRAVPTAQAAVLFLQSLRAGEYTYPRGRQASTSAIIKVASTGRKWLVTLR